MELLVFGKDVKLTPSVRFLIRTATDHLEAHFRHMLSAQWDLAFERFEIRVSCRLHARSGFYRASSRSKKLRTAVDDVVQKIQTQRRRKKVIVLRARRQSARKR
ncbi:MAG: HPF/RaiA family ribosome-associated protein [Candidatus Zixiibacteriota bacterium]